LFWNQIFFTKNKEFTTGIHQLFNSLPAPVVTGFLPPQQTTAEHTLHAVQLTYDEHQQVMLERKEHSININLSIDFH
jgi:hypothetical protein